MTSIGLASKKAISRLSAATGVAPSAAGTARRATSAWMWASSSAARRPTLGQHHALGVERVGRQHVFETTRFIAADPLRLGRLGEVPLALCLVDPKHSLDDDHGRSLAARTGDS